MVFLDFLHHVTARQSLSAEQAEQAMTLVLEGSATTPQLAAFLVALKMKGETSAEILGFARAMRARCSRVDAGAGPLVDTSGTGGDGQSTFNISTVAAFVAAGAGARVAKHGNRSLASHCGSADILEALGVNIALTPEQMGACIRDVGIGFLFAPALHPAMKHAQPARAELKMRTAFNLLGPLTNPAGARYQIAGAPSVEAAKLMAGALAELGVERAFVVHGADGMDEITTTSATTMFDVRPGNVRRTEVTPNTFGVPAARLRDLKAEDREANLRIARAVLDGESGAARDVALVNASAVLVAVGLAPDFRSGTQLAAKSIDSGAARDKLAKLVAAALPNSPTVSALPRLENSRRAGRPLVPREHSNTIRRGTRPRRDTRSSLLASPARPCGRRCCS